MLEEKTQTHFVIKIVMLLIFIAALVFFGRQASAYVLRFANWVHELGPLGPLIFILGYAVACVAFIPGSILTLAAGAIFGLMEGSVIVFIAATLGASAAFLVSRYLARSPIEKKLAGNKKFAAIDQAIGEQGKKIVFLLRLSPIFPFNLLNYGLGLTRVKFGDYLIASIGMLPGTVLYVYYGKLAGDVALLAAGTPVAKGTSYYAVLLVGLIATIAVSTIVTRIAKKALQEATHDIA